MDQNRQIRFLIPPFFFFVSLLLGAYLDPEICFENIKIFSDNFGFIITIIGISILPIGYLIGTISIIVLRIFFFFITWGKYKYATYDAFFPKDFIKEHIWPKLRMEKDFCNYLLNSNFIIVWLRKKSITLISTVTFDHELLNSRILDWLVRRWSAFNVSVNSIVALVISLLVGKYIFSINCTWQWIACNIAVILMFLISGFFAFFESIEMVKFQSYRKVKSRPNFLRRPELR